LLKKRHMIFERSFILLKTSPHHRKKRCLLYVPNFIKAKLTLWIIVNL